MISSAFIGQNGLLKIYNLRSSDGFQVFSHIQSADTFLTYQSPQFHGFIKFHSHWGLLQFCCSPPVLHPLPSSEASLQSPPAHPAALLRSVERALRSAASLVQKMVDRKPWYTSWYPKEMVSGYGSIPIDTIFSGMNIHLPAILGFTRGTRF